MLTRFRFWSPIGSDSCRVGRTMSVGAHWAACLFDARRPTWGLTPAGRPNVKAVLFRGASGVEVAEAVEQCHCSLMQCRGRFVEWDGVRRPSAGEQINVVRVLGYLGSQSPDAEWTISSAVHLMPWHVTPVARPSVTASSCPGRLGSKKRPRRSIKSVCIS